MKIPLQTNSEEGQTAAAARTKALQHDLLASKKGDWEARNSVIRTFTPLLTSMAEKRSSDTREVGLLVDAGKAGLEKAIKKYKPNMGADMFQLFALKFVEKQMDSPSGGFFSRLFGS